MSVGLSSRTGVIPISTTLDTVGPLAKSTYDAALILENMVGFDPKDPFTEDAVIHTLANYTQFTSAQYATFKGKTLATPRTVFYNEMVNMIPTEEYEALDVAVNHMRSLGAQIVDPGDVPSALELIDFAART